MGDVVVHVVDSLSGADIATATVLAAPTGTSVQTDASGRALFLALPIGVYQFTAQTPGLKLLGNAMVTTSDVSEIGSPIAVRAGVTVAADLKIRRFDPDMLNLTTVHDSTKAQYSVANCKACHGLRTGELSADPLNPPYHAKHSGFGCLTCHATVDLAQSSAATIRKQVAVTLCASCHTQYPTKICKIPTCP